MTEANDWGIQRFGWSADGLHDAKGPNLAIRSVYEARLIQRAMALLTPRGQLGIEIGAGYGRLTSVLADYCDQVIGFEREPDLVERANQLHRDCTFRPIDVLWKIPLPDKSVDVAITFTVLQHLASEDVQKVLAELDRVVKPTGAVVLTEDYLPNEMDESVLDRNHLFTVPRPTAYYQRHMPNFELRGVVDRILERGTWAGDHVVGKSMAFARRT